MYGSVTNSAITTNDNLTLLSRDTSTARFGEIVTGSGNSINGKANIERYLFAKKSWRLLATPINVSLSPSTTAAWREGAASLASTGYGTQITGPASFVGMDSYTQRASMKFYNSAVNNFVDVTNTNTTTLANNKGYFVFVRGDRAVPVTGAAGITILRMKGNVLTGNQTFPVPALKFESIGNPYPSRIDFRTVTKTNIANSFIAWNPNSAGLYNVGAYETYAFNGTNYVKAGGFVRNFIESGEAVYIQSNAALAGSLLVKEADKVASSSMQSRENITWPTLEITLLASNADSGYYVADGVMVNFDSAYKQSFNNDDVRKFLNTYDNISIPLEGHNLFAERRLPLNPFDSIPLKITAMRKGNYRLQTDPSLLQLYGAYCFLRDTYLATETIISLNSITDIDFFINEDPLSKATDTFTLLFKPGNLLPVVFTSVNATRNNQINDVQWKTDIEMNIDHYTVQYSKDGQNFKDIARVQTYLTIASPKQYNYLHAGANVANMFYRIVAHSFNGQTKTSNTVKVASAYISSTVSIFPNPVNENYFTVNLNNNVPGKYRISISNLKGDQLFKTIVNLPFEHATKKVHLPASLVAGTYLVKIINNEKIINSFKILIL